jgi:hypothetical protein
MQLLSRVIRVKSLDVEVVIYVVSAVAVVHEVEGSRAAVLVERAGPWRDSTPQGFAVPLEGLDAPPCRRNVAVARRCE